VARGRLCGAGRWAWRRSGRTSVPGCRAEAEPGNHWRIRQPAAARRRRHHVPLASTASRWVVSPTCEWPRPRSRTARRRTSVPATTSHALASSREAENPSWSSGTPGGTGRTSGRCSSPEPRGLRDEPAASPGRSDDHLRATSRRPSIRGRPTPTGGGGRARRWQRSSRSWSGGATSQGDRRVGQRQGHGDSLRRGSWRHGGRRLAAPCHRLRVGW